MKKLLISLAMLSVFSASNAALPVEGEDNPMWAMFKDNAGVAFNWIGERLQNGAEFVERQYDKHLEELRRVRAENQAIVDNPYGHSEERVRMATEALARIAQEEEDTRKNKQKAVNGAIEIGQEGMRGFLDIGKQYAQAEIAAQKEQKIAAIQAHVKAQADLQDAQNARERYITELRDPKNMLRLAGYGLALTGAVYGSARLIKYGMDKLEKPVPTIFKETSFKSLAEASKEAVFGKKKESANVADVILEAALSERIEQLAKTIKSANENGTYLQNILFWGRPGTGKTMIAKLLARSSGFEYGYFAASSLDQLPIEEAIAKLTEMFRFAESSGRKLMIIIDEAELLFRSRKEILSERTQKILNFVLTYTGTESRDFMFVLLTNLPEMLDEAVSNRMDEQIEIPAPALTERIGILNKYIKDLLIDNKGQEYETSFISRWFVAQPIVKRITIEEGALSEDAVRSIAQSIDGFVGRDISKLIIKLQSNALTNDGTLLTRQMIADAVAQKIQEKKQSKEGFKRTEAQN